MNARVRTCVFVVTTSIALAVQVAMAVDVKVESDKAFDFKAARTWDWNPKGAGDVKMARTQQDDPDAMKKEAEPIIKDAVAMEMGRRGLQLTASGPALHVTYYLLLTTNMSSQTLGQFLPANTMWGVPPFAPQTQSLEIMNQGSLVLDVSAGDHVVWRGVANGQIKTDTTPKKREELLREAIRDLMKKYPPK
jgi:hypothetical protein